MKKYLQILKTTWAEYMVYRLNFVLWRVRVVMQLLVTYFLWWAIVPREGTIFGYSQQMILTYIMLTAITRTLIMGTRTQDVGTIIAQSNLSNYLVKPFSFLRFNIAREAADKLMNVIFAVVELGILIFLLRPPIFIQSNFFQLSLTIIALFMGIGLFFFFSLILSYFAFWTPEVWAPRFLSFVLAEFFTGVLFPLDILPQPLYQISSLLPFAYFIYFPLKVYLGQIASNTLLSGFAVGGVWLFIFWYLTVLVWKKGLRVYTAEGK